MPSRKFCEMTTTKLLFFFQKCGDFKLSEIKIAVIIVLFIKNDSFYDVVVISQNFREIATTA